MNKLSWVVLVIIIVLALGFFFWDDLIRLYFQPTESNIPTATSSRDISRRDDITVVAENLSVPWDVIFVPTDGRAGFEILVTERTGALTRVGEDGSVSRIEVPGVTSRGEGGLLGMTLHPDFEENHWLYLYETYKLNGNTRNRVIRYVYEEGIISDPYVVIEDIPGAAYHDGGRIRFGPQGLLYITTGDAGVEGNAQDKNSLAGKILRLRDDGKIPANNPFSSISSTRVESTIFSYGHRNPQGLTWDSQGKLWSTEHGRSGVRSGFDELNLIVAGGNYGWPVIQGSEDSLDMLSPVLNSGPDDTWAPASALFWDGSIFWGGLRGEALYEAVISGDEAADLKRHFPEAFGRIRSVVLGPDEFFYIMTSNTDGRGEAREGDDKIIRINPALFR